MPIKVVEIGAPAGPAPNGAGRPASGAAAGTGERAAPAV